MKMLVRRKTSEINTVIYIVNTTLKVPTFNLFLFWGTTVDKTFPQGPLGSNQISDLKVILSDMLKRYHTIKIGRQNWENPVDFQ